MLTLYVYNRRIYNLNFLKELNGNDGPSQFIGQLRFTKKEVLDYVNYTFLQKHEVAVLGKIKKIN